MDRAEPVYRHIPARVGRTTRWKRFGAVAVTIAVVLSMSSCALLQTRSGLTLKQAKSQAQKMENRIAGLVPERYVVSSRQEPKGPILPRGRDSLTWNGHTTIALTKNRDLRKILDSIVSGIKRDGNYQVELGEYRDATPKAFIYGPFGAEYIAGPSVDETEYEITSYSPWFQLPEDTWTGGKF